MSQTAWTEPGSPRLKRVSLEGGRVRLIPLSPDQLQDLAWAALDERIWTWMPSAGPTTRPELEAFIAAAMAEWEAGRQLPFVVQEISSGRLIGGTRFLNLDPAHRRLEIGATWLHPSAQGSGANNEAKLLLMSYAFEQLHCQRVEFKTDSLNLRSQAALRKIGAVEEGTLRNHMLTHEGRRRHSVYFSVIVEEWPQVKARLQALCTVSRPD